MFGCKYMYNYVYTTMYILQPMLLRNKVAFYGERIFEIGAVVLEFIRYNNLSSLYYQVQYDVPINVK